METIFEEKISIYEGVTDNTGRIATVAEFLGMGEAYKEQIAELRAASTDEERRALKQKIKCAATISGIFEPTRKADNLKEHSGLVCIDIDHRDPNEIMPLLMDMDIIAYASRSIGGNGVFAIIPIANPERHGEHFEALRLVFKERFGIELDATQDVCRLRFVSYDPEAFWRPDAKVWEGVWSEPKRKTIPKATTAPTITTNATTFQKSATVPQADRETTIARAKACADEVVRRGISLCETNKEWYVMAGALKDIGNEGREIFHQISRVWPKYDAGESDAEFNRAMRETRKADIGTFFSRCEANGILWKNLDWRKYQSKIMTQEEWKRLYPNSM